MKINFKSKKFIIISIISVILILIAIIAVPLINLYTPVKFNNIEKLEEWTCIDLPNSAEIVSYQHEKKNLENEYSSYGIMYRYTVTVKIPTEDVDKLINSVSNNESVYYQNQTDLLKERITHLNEDISVDQVHFVGWANMHRATTEDNVRNHWLVPSVLIYIAETETEGFVIFEIF